MRMKNKQVILAVSPGGAVRLFEDDGSYDEIFEQKIKESTVTIRPDMKKKRLKKVRAMQQLKDLWFSFFMPSVNVLVQVTVPGQVSLRISAQIMFFPK